MRSSGGFTAADVLAAYPLACPHRVAVLVRAVNGDPEARAEVVEAVRHMGPGPHPSGTPQAIHGGGLGAVNVPMTLDDLPDADRGRLEAWCEKNGVDVEALDADLAEALEDPDALASGMNWYSDEFGSVAQQIADETGVSVEEATGLLAITSAQSKWGSDGIYGNHTNQSIAYQMALGHKTGRFDGMSADEAALACGYFKGEGFGRNAIQMLRGERSMDLAVTGAKRRSFFNNGLRPDVSMDVTNDVWMGSLLVKNSGIGIGQVQGMLSAKPPAYLARNGVHSSPAYFVLTSSIRKAATAKGIKPHQAQAAGWFWAQKHGLIGARIKGGRKKAGAAA